MQDDPTKLEQALEELQAERDRRLAEKIEKGATPRIVITGSEDTPVELNPGEVMWLHVVTGVCRGDEPGPRATAAAPRELADDLWKYNYPPAPAEPRPAPVPTSAPRKIRVQTAAPIGDSPGATEEFTYIVAGKMLTVSDCSGMPVGSVGVSPGDDFDAAARRVASRCRDKNSAFWRQLN